MEFKGILSTCKRGSKETSEEGITRTQGRDNDGPDWGENSESGKKKKWAGSWSILTVKEAFVSSLN